MQYNAQVMQNLGLSAVLYPVDPNLLAYDDASILQMLAAEPAQEYKTQKGRGCSNEEGKWPSADYRIDTKITNDTQACQAACDAEAKCTGFRIRFRDQNCRLYTYPNMTANVGSKGS